MNVGELVVRLGIDLKAFESKLDEVKEKLTSTLGSEAMSASRALVGGFSLLGAAIGGVAIASVKMAADMEQTQIAFTTMLGSADRAKQFLEELTDFAERTPFELPGLIEASQQLMAFGFEAEKIIPIMTAVGDATAALGGGEELINRIVYALGQMRQKGKVSGEEMKQLAEAGIPAWQMLADAIGVSVPEAMKLVERGAVNSKAAVDVLVKGMEDRFKGLMEQQSKTIGGMFSTLRDTVASIMREIGNDIIKTFNLKEKLAGALDWLQEFADTVKEVGIGEALRQMIPPEVRTAIVAIAGAITGAMIPALINMALSAVKVVVALGPWSAVAAAVAIAAYLIIENWGPISTWFTNMMRMISYEAQKRWLEIQAAVANAVKGILEKLVFLEKVPGLGQGFAWLRDAIAKFADDAATKLQNLPRPILEVYKSSDQLKKKTKELTEAQQENAQATREQAQSQKTADDILEEMRVRLEQVSVKEALLGDQFDENAEASKILLDTINQLVEMGYKPTDKVLQDLARHHKDLNPAQDNAALILERLHNNLALVDAKAQVFGATTDALSEKINLYKQAIVDLLEQGLDPLDRRIVELQEEMQALEQSRAPDFFARVTAGVKELATELKDRLDTALAESLVALGDFATTGAEKWTNFKKVVADIITWFVTSVVKKVIATSGLFATVHQAVVALATSLKSMNPFVMLAAAAAAIAMVGWVNSQLAGLAKGGLVLRPTLAVVGEGSSHEAVLPLNESVFSRMAAGIANYLTPVESEPASKTEVHLHVGTLVADELGLKKLERELARIRIQENIRKGVVS